MDGMAVGLGIFVAGGIIVYLARPWWQRDDDDGWLDSAPALTTDTTALSDRHEALLLGLRDLDFDYAVGKVIQADYGPLRQTLLGEIAAVMTQRDEQQAAMATDQIEAEVPAVRQKIRTEQPLSTGGSCLTCGQISRTGDLYCRRCGTGLKTACPDCGEIVSPTDRFCIGCGIELAMAISG
jgi:hypothetical protein